MLKYSSVIIGFLCWVLMSPAFGQEAENNDMNNIRLEKLIALVDENYQGQEGLWALELEGVTLRIVTDENADRMRIIAPIVKAKSLEKDKLYRMMQANFDSTLDARYAIAQGMLWATFIHPLSSLTDGNFLSGLGQTVNTVISYGNTYSSGAMLFGGGDSGQLQQEILERLRRLSEAI